MMRRSVGRSALLASLAAFLFAGCTTSTVSSPKAITSPQVQAQAQAQAVVTSYSTIPHVRDGRFMAPFKLDGGGLLVLPVAASYAPNRKLASVRTQAWATSQIAPLAPYVVGLGKVTITRQSSGVRPVRDLVAWVALANDSGVVPMCGALHGPFRPLHTHPPSSGWSAVVIGDATGSPAVVYRSTAVVCETLGRSTVETATEVISTPWTLSSSDVVATAPSCSSFTESDWNSSPTSTSFRYLVSIPEDKASPAVPGSRALPKCLPTGTTKSVDLSADPETKGVVPSSLHEPTGLLRQVSPTPYGGPPNTSTSPSVLASLAHWTPAPGAGVLGYLPSSNGREATIFSWSGRRLGHFHAAAGEQILESDSASALSPNGKRVLVERGTSVSVLTSRGRFIGRFSADYDVMWGNDSVHVCALQLPSHGSTTSPTRATLVVADPGYKSRIVAQVTGFADHQTTQLVACDTAGHLAAVETKELGRGIAVTYVNLKTGAQYPAPWYRVNKMGTVDISGDGRFAVTDAGTVISTSTGRVVGRVPGQPIAISWLGHVVVVMADNGQNPEVIDWTVHTVVWRYRTHVAPCPCSSIWVIASSRTNSDDVAVNVPLRADRAVPLWLVTFRGSAQHLGSVAPLHP